MKILILGIGNVLFGDEGIGAYLAHYIEENYTFISNEHSVDVVDGGTLAQRLIPIIIEYDLVYVIDCVDVKDAKVGDIYFFDYDKIPPYITWQGSAHEVEMLQTLQMIDMYGDRPPTKIVGVVPYVIGEDSTFEITDKMKKASMKMVKIIIDELEKLGIEAKKSGDVPLESIIEKTCFYGVPNDTRI